MKAKEKLYYTLPGFDEVYEDYQSADKKKNSLGIKERFPFGFQKKEEAEMLRSGNWENYFKESCARYETKADALVCVDGSWTTGTKNNPIADCGYGICIFYKTGETYCESGKIVDGEIGHYTIKRYDDKGDLVEIAEEEYEDMYSEKDETENKHGYALASHNVTGEIEAAMRAMDICIRQKKLKNIDLVFDCERVEERYHRIDDNIQSNVELKYQKFLKQLHEDFDFDVDFKWAHSHNQEDIKEKIYPILVYNDVVDILGKAEATDIKISATDVPNLTKALPDCNFKGFYYAGANTSEKKRDYVRGIYRAIVERISPIFVD